MYATYTVRISKGPAIDFLYFSRNRSISEFTGGKVTNEFEMKAALDSTGGVKGARCCIVKPNRNVAGSVAYKPIPGINSYTSFFYQGSGKMKVQMAYGIGGKVQHNLPSDPCKWRGIIRTYFLRQFFSVSDSTDEACCTG